MSGLSLSISAIARISSFSNTPPVGLQGLLIIISFVFGVIRLLNFSISSLKLLSAVMGSGTGTPSANFMQLSYIGNPGLGYITSSPGLTRVSIVKNMVGFPPGTIAIFSKSASTFLYFFAYSATVFLSSLYPNVGPYPVYPCAIALSAASIIFEGVWKSGWPISRCITSIPFSSKAFAFERMAKADSPLSLLTLSAIYDGVVLYSCIKFLLSRTNVFRIF